MHRKERIFCTEQLPELNNRPRIILAADSIDDQELTSSVFWLRGFNVDITCVEITPYRILDSGKIFLVPKIVVPLPEARDYLVKVERKEVAQVQQRKDQAEYALLWQAIANAFNQLDTPFRTTGKSSTSYQKVNIRHPNIHYEWVVRKRAASLDVALHFESKDQQENYKRLKLIQDNETAIREGISLEFEAGPWGRKWAEVKFRLPLSDGQPTPAIAQEGASMMKTLIDRTYPILQAGIL